MEKICPDVLIIDETCKYYPNTFQISEYIEGENLQNVLTDKCNEQLKKEIYFKMGVITAKINQIEIDSENQYIMSRKSWEDLFADKLHTSLSRIIDNDFITTEEMEIITNNMRKKKAQHTRSFLHNDIRPDNIIYNDELFFILDAEECEFGDPLHELARISQVDNDEFIKGYKSINDIDENDELYYYYKIEQLAMLLDCHFNRGAGNSLTQFFVNSFVDIKAKLLKTK